MTARWHPAQTVGRHMSVKPAGNPKARPAAFVAFAVFVASACARGSTSTRIGAWSALPAGPPLRVGHSAIWDGHEMLIWGGQEVQGGRYRADGASFDPARDAWSPIPPAPLEPRSDHSAVWTGSELIVWGGGTQGPAPTRSFADGAAYDPETRSWRRIARSPLERRVLHGAVWTGSRMLVWGGVDLGGGEGEESAERGGDMFNDGASYDPVQDRWRRLAPAPLSPRAGAAVVWTGSVMIVWGGGSVAENGPAFSDGAAYDPSTDRWRRIAPAVVRGGGRVGAVWTGRSVLIWGGSRGRGAAYDPAHDRWSGLPPAPLPVTPTPTAVWTGRWMLVWGEGARLAQPGSAGSEGAAFDPREGEWRQIAPAPHAPGFGQTAVWTGRAMLLWGGFTAGGRFSSGAAFDPGSDAVRARSPRP